MASNQAIKNVAHGDDPQPMPVQMITLRIPVDLYKAVSHEAIERETTHLNLWIDAMRAYLKAEAA